MLIISIIFLLLSNAVTLRRDKSILYNNRIAIIIILFYTSLAFNSLYISYLDRGIRLFGGLFHATSITQIFHIFIFIISMAILQLTAFYPRKVVISDFSSELDNIILYNDSDRESSIESYLQDDPFQLEKKRRIVEELKLELKDIQEKIRNMKKKATQDFTSIDYKCIQGYKEKLATYEDAKKHVERETARRLKEDSVELEESKKPKEDKSENDEVKANSFIEPSEEKNNIFEKFCLFLLNLLALVSENLELNTNSQLFVLALVAVFVFIAFIMFIACKLYEKCNQYINNKYKNGNNKKILKPKTKAKINQKNIK